MGPVHWGKNCANHKFWFLIDMFIGTLSIYMDFPSMFEYLGIILIVFWEYAGSILAIFWNPPTSLSVARVGTWNGSFSCTYFPALKATKTTWRHDEKRSDQDTMAYVLWYLPVLCFWCSRSKIRRLASAWHLSSTTLRWLCLWPIWAHSDVSPLWWPSSGGNKRSLLDIWQRIAM